MPIYALYSREMTHTLAPSTSHGSLLYLRRLLFSQHHHPRLLLFLLHLHSGAASDSALASVWKSRRLLVSRASPAAPDASASSRLTLALGPLFRQPAGGCSLRSNLTRNKGSELRPRLLDDIIWEDRCGEREGWFDWNMCGLATRQRSSLGSHPPSPPAPSSCSQVPLSAWTSASGVSLPPNFFSVIWDVFMDTDPNTDLTSDTHTLIYRPSHTLATYVRCSRRISGDVVKVDVSQVGVQGGTAIATGMDVGINPDGEAEQELEDAP
ncbi:hypothetical protein D9619_011748 [Psilocybe cf. subviscida]|uniref:Uncharacterized protein n=1 Tax=Psilocybe cf. subviscida TaxID=2480587 RepID=A0A8H5EW19_9AGAR|nr:hypothetical protein D9619_011748 [Psilocybe cf. subviscida]